MRAGDRAVDVGPRIHSDGKDVRIVLKVLGKARR